MRLLRVLAVATGFAALLSQSSAAQDGRQFKDAWFWGMKAGGLVYTSPTTNTGGAPIVGAEWLITRTRGGLYLSFDQAFLRTQGQFIAQDPDSVFIRSVRLKNLRRFTMAGMVFPKQTRNLHPYAGFGLAFNQIAGTELLTGTTNTSQYRLALDSIQAKKTAFSPILITGVQARLRRMSVFVQGTASPTQASFFLNNATSARKFHYSLEGGMRYNVGSSIDRAR